MDFVQNGEVMSYANGPKIVTNGLVLCLDAGNSKSYPGSGNTWYDISGNIYTGTLTNGVVFDNGNGGNIVFDGINDYVTCGTIPFTSNLFSLELIFSWNDYNTSTIGFIIAGVNEQIEVHTGGGAGTNGLRFIPYDAPTYGLLDVPNVISNGINHVIFTAAYSSPSKAYKNGQLVGTSASTSTIGLNANQTLNIGRRSNNTYFFDGKIYSIKIYNRVLENYEIVQNYNALKGRFNL